MSRTPRAEIATNRLASRCLRRTGSLFTPGRRLWTATRARDLAARLTRAAQRADDPQRTDRSPFVVRWRRTLARAEPDTVRLAAEILYVHLLFPTNVSAARKRALLAATCERLDAPPALPPALDAALEAGIAPVGLAYTRRRLSQLAWLAAAAATWWELAPPVRREALADPWRFADALDGVDVAGGGPQRAALCHLVHPATFTPITSATVKRAILRAYPEHVPEGERDADRALAAVRAALEPVHGQGFSFFAPEIARTWQ